MNSLQQRRPRQAPDRTGSVYLLHFSTPISGHAGHYLGWASDLAERLRQHEHGRGARLTRVAIERGISWELVRTWRRATRTDERRLKGLHGRRLCPLCGSVTRGRLPASGATRPSGAGAGPRPDRRRAVTLAEPVWTAADLDELRAELEFDQAVNR